MSKEKKQNKNTTVNQSKQVRIDNDYSAYYLIVLFIVAFIPTIVFMKPVPIHPEVMGHWVDDNHNVEFFSYYKSMLTIWMAVFALITGGLLYIQKRLDTSILTNKLVIIPVGIYGLLNLLSALFSDYPHTALWGFPDRYEGAIVIVAYLVIMLITALIIQTEKHLRALVYAIMASSTVISVIGVGQFFGYDFFRTTFGKKLMLPMEHYYMIDSLNFTFGKNTIYATLYNTNYVGSFGALLLPIAIMLVLYARTPKHKIIAWLYSCIIFATWIGSNSRAGLVGGLSASIILIILIRKLIIPNWKSIAGLLVSFALIFTVMNSVSDDRLTGKYESLGAQLDSADVETIENLYLQDIITDMENGTVTLVTQRNSVQLVLRDSSLAFLDASGETLPVTSDKDDDRLILTIAEPGYEDYRFEFDNNVIYTSIYRYKMMFGLTADGIFLLNNDGRVVEIEDIPKWGFEGRELMGSSRGYIWSRSIPLLADHILLGAGPDIYPIIYPQHDYLGKIQFLSGVEMIVDKPHNMYLQIALGSGLVSLATVLFLWAYYGLSSLWTLLPGRPETLSAHLGIGILVGVAGYLVAGIFNDSLVSLAPLFWMMLGMGLAANYMVKKNKEADM